MDDCTNNINKINNIISEVKQFYNNKEDEKEIILSMFNSIKTGAYFNFIEIFIERFSDKITIDLINHFFFSIIARRKLYLFSYMLSLGAQINGVDFYGNKLIDYFYIGNRNIEEEEERLKRLLEIGWDINSKTDDGYTILMSHFSTRHIPQIQLLLKYGANPSIKNNAGKSCFDLLRYKSGKKGVVALRKLMKQYGEC